DPGREVLARVALRRLLGQAPAGLGGDVDLLAPLAAEAGDQPLAAAVAVDVRGVDEVRARVHRGVQGAHGLLVVHRAPRAADRPGAEADRGDGQAGAAERAVLHRYLPAIASSSMSKSRVEFAG